MHTIAPGFFFLSSHAKCLCLCVAVHLHKEFQDDDKEEGRKKTLQQQTGEKSQQYGNIQNT